MAVTRDAVVWAFRLVLGREPEDEQGIAAHMRLADEQALIETLLRSAEFRGSGRFADVLQLREGSSRERQSPWPHSARSTLRLVMFGNCQAAGVARLVQALTGDASARAHETTPAFLRRVRGGELDLAAAVAGADLVWMHPQAELKQALQKAVPGIASRLRLLPTLNYGGYHPDCVYIAREGGGHLAGPMGEYHSSIAFWAWRQGLSVDQTVALFDAPVFEHLGFGAYHAAAEKVLLEHGRATGLPLAQLLDGWRRRGCFMHTVNHPQQHALADLVAAALRREGIEPLHGAGAWLEDGLARWPVWPLYPPLADAACGPGSYLFKLDSGLTPLAQPVLAMDLPQFVHSAFKVYGQAGGGLRCDRVETEPYAGLSRFVPERPGLGRRLKDMADALGSRLRPAGWRVGPGPAQASPYAGLPDHRFWRRAVERVAPGQLDPVVHASFRLDRQTRVATAGSCFAQHIARTLQRQQFNYLVVDRPDGLSPQEAQRRQFGVFSARYGNLYTARQLLQLFDQAHGDFTPLDQAWQRADGRHVDPFRPQIEPDGFAKPADVVRARRAHLADVRGLFAALDVFVFTLGLTEGWRRRADGAVFPLAPGVAGGSFDPALYEFVNFGTQEVLDDLRAFVRRLRRVNPDARVILTVSPVPLIATYEDRHVLVSTMHSKSVLRAAAGELAADTPGVDYFPSYEIVAGTPTRGAYFDDDLRSVRPEGVAHVMRVFLRHYAGIAGEPGTDLPAPAPSAAGPSRQAMEREQQALSDIVCDEEAIDRHRPA